MWQNVYVESHERLDNGKWRVVAMSKHAEGIADRASQMYADSTRPRVQFDHDFVETNTSHIFGHTGLADYKHKNWELGIVAVQNGTENTEDSLALLRPTVDVFASIQKEHLLENIGSDGSQAILKAARTIGKFVNNCYTHKRRSGGTRGGGYRGGKGSIPRYLTDALHVPRKLTAQVSNCVQHAGV